MVTALISVAAYIIIHCWAKKLNVIDYVSQNKYMLGLILVAAIIVNFLPSVALITALISVAMPWLAMYSIPSLLVKLKEIAARLLPSLFAPKPE